jgi:hypothetical protein
MADTFAAGGLTFEVEHRTFGDDGGPALMVYSQVDGQRRQLLRFDCFVKDPHYHHDPDGQDDRRHLTGMTVPQSVDFTIDAVRGRLPEMLHIAGFDALVDGLDEPALADVAERIEAAMQVAQA